MSLSVNARGGILHILISGSGFATAMQIVLPLRKSG